MQADLGIHLVDQLMELTLHLAALHLQRRGEQAIGNGEAFGAHPHIAELGIFRQILGQRFGRLANLVQDRLIVEQLTDVRIVDVQRLGNLLQTRLRGLHEQGEEGSVVAQEHGMLEQRIGLQQCLDRLRRNVLAALGHDDVLQPIGDEQETAPIDASHIAGAQPTALVVGEESVLGGQVMAPIAVHHIGTLVENLVVVAELETPTRHHPPHRSGAIGLVGVERDERRSLGHAIAVENLQSGSGEEDLGFTTQWRTTAHKHGFPAPDCGADIAQHQTVGQRQLDAPPDRRLLAAAIVQLQTFTHPQGPPHDAVLHRRGIGSLVGPLEHRLVELGHCHHERGARLSHELAHLGGVDHIGVHAAIGPHEAGPATLKGV